MNCRPFGDQGGEDDLDETLAAALNFADKGLVARVDAQVTAVRQNTNH